jgi:SPP1 family predicted phage head-tail adaptor
VTTARLDPGELAHRVAVEFTSGTGDEAGGETVVWTPLATVWGRVEPTDSRERIVAGHLSGVVTHAVTLRWRGDIAGGMRIIHRGRVLRILAVQDMDESRRYLIAKTEQETA